MLRSGNMKEKTKLGDDWSGIEIVRVEIFRGQIFAYWAAIVVKTSKEPVCPRVELILKIIIILLIIFQGFIKSKPC